MREGLTADELRQAGQSLRGCPVGLAVIDELAKIFPEAHISYSYYEAGWGFYGDREYENGSLIYSNDAESDDEDDNEEFFGE